MTWSHVLTTKCCILISIRDMQTFYLQFVKITKTFFFLSRYGFRIEEPNGDVKKKWKRQDWDLTNTTAWELWVELEDPAWPYPWTRGLRLRYSVLYPDFYLTPRRGKVFQRFFYLFPRNSKIIESFIFVCRYPSYLTPPVVAETKLTSVNSISPTSSSATDARSTSIAALRLKAKEHVESLTKGLQMVWTSV